MCSMGFYDSGCFWPFWPAEGIGVLTLALSACLVFTTFKAVKMLGWKEFKIVG